MRSIPTYILCAALNFASAWASATQDDLIEEIVVQGEFHKPFIDETPASVSVISLNDQRRTVVNHLEEVLGWAPNVNFASGGSRARFFQIRAFPECLSGACANGVCPGCVRRRVDY